MEDTAPRTDEPTAPRGDPVTQEVRLAMALNGGVSLAVWMGGCAVELDCARRAHWGPDDLAFDDGNPDKPRFPRTVYRALCTAFKRELVIDIMSGASAGGVNGGLLAGAMVSGRRLHPTYVRNQWLTLGDFSELLHSSTEPAPRSLLRGQHFIDSLLAVFEDLAADEADARKSGLAVPESQLERARRSIPNLDVTVTDVRGTERTYRDQWGGIFSAREYRRRFSFRREADFTPANLAVAARCSASFPAAFEPFRANPDSWKLTDRRDLPPSGEGPPWTIDGGLLDNAPIRAAIELIPTRAAKRQVKRYLVYVNPDPHEGLQPGAATVGTNADGQTLSDAPELGDVVGYVVTLPRKLPFVDQLDAIEDAVERSSVVEDGALPLLAQPLDTLEGAANALLPPYSSRRRLKSIREMLGDPAAAERAYRTVSDSPQELPWIPTTLDLGDLPSWNWGLSTAIRICHFLLDLIRTGMSERPGDRPRFLDARVRLDRPLAGLQAAYLGAEDERAVFDALRSADSPLSPADTVAALQGLAGDQSGALPAVRSAICIFATLLLELGDDLSLPADAPDGVETGVALLGAGWREDGEFGAVCALSPPGRADAPLTEPERRCLRRLLAIEVIRRAYTAEEPVDSAQRLSFVQLTPDAATPILSRPNSKPFDASAETKLTGIRLGHFAGFLKRSWRANDFMWGRLDAATRIVDLLVDPARADELGTGVVAGELANALLEDATLEQLWLLAESLAIADDGASEPPTTDQLEGPLLAALTEDLADPDRKARFTRTVFTRAAQLEIVRAELPAIADASREDAADGSATKRIDFGEADEGTKELPPGVLWDVIENVRQGEPLPKRLGRDDPAETTSDLTARMAARAGFVTLAALRTAKLPASRALDVLRPPLLAVTGMSARGVFLRIPLILGFWAAALYLAARVVETTGSADLDKLRINDLLLALVAVLTVVGVAVLPLVRGLRRTKEPVAIGEFAAALGIVVVGGAAAIGLALVLGDDVTAGKLIIGNGFDGPPDGVLDLAVVVALGLPLARATLLRRAPSWVLGRSQGGGASAALLGVVAILVSVWTVQALVNTIDEGPAWRTIAALIAMSLPPVVCGLYLLLHNVSSGPRSRLRS